MRPWRWIALVLVLLLAAASISVRVGQTLHVAGTTGEPVVAYVVYRYEGHYPNFVHPVTYEASALALARSDTNGRVRFPPAVHVHWPFPLQTYPTLQIELAYAPALHNAVWYLGPFTDPQPDVFEYDQDRRRLVMSDLSGRPERWEQALERVASTIQSLARESSSEAPLGERHRASADLALEVIAHFRREYDEFLARHGEAARPMPEMPYMASDEDKRRWQETVEADLANEPTWRPRIARLVVKYESLLRECEAALR
jgi:hypothetical protein